jgi:membrane protein
LLRHSLKSLRRERVPEAAASISFFTLFSLFPVLALLLWVSSLVDIPADATNYLLSMFNDIMPPSGYAFIQQRITHLQEQKITLGIVGAAGLLWSSSGMFAILERNINRAWKPGTPRNMLLTRTVAVVSVVGLVVLFVLFLLLDSSLSLLAQSDIAAQFEPVQNLTLRLVSHSTVYLFSFAVLLLLYRLVPRAVVRWSDAATGALGALVLSQLFTFLMRNLVNLFVGGDRYDVVYGSLSSLIVVMMWLYGITTILLWGGHLCAARARWRSANAE